MVNIKNNQKGVFWGIVIVLYLIISVFLINTFFLKNDSTFYLILDDYTLLMKKDGLWSNESNNKKVSKEKFAIYYDGNYQGAYYLQYNNKWFIYDEYDKVVTKKGALLAYNGNRLLDVIRIDDELITMDDYSNIDNAVSKLGYPRYNEISLFDKVYYDLDHDKKNEVLYAISNVYSSKQEELFYSIVFLVDGDNIIIVDSDTNKDMYSTATYELSYLIDIDKNKKYEFIVMRDYFSNPEDTCHSLYEYHNEVVELVGC